MTAATAASPFHTAWDAVPAETVLPGVTRQVVHGERQTIIRYLYAPGAVFPAHEHPEEQATVVVRGRIAFEINGATYELGPGELAVIPGGAAHGARVVGDETVETINCLSPRRAAGPTFNQEGAIRR